MNLVTINPYLMMAADVMTKASNTHGLGEVFLIGGHEFLELLGINDCRAVETEVTSNIANYTWPGN
jgi:hypothetical protein